MKFEKHIVDYGTVYLSFRVASKTVIKKLIIFNI